MSWHKFHSSFYNFRYVGRLFVKGNGKPFEILTKLNEMAGYPPEEEIELYEVWASSLQYIVIKILNFRICIDPTQK